MNQPRDDRNPCQPCSSATVESIRRELDAFPTWRVAYDAGVLDAAIATGQRRDAARAGESR